MNCASCAAVLPVGAMFCGECGRSVGPSAQPARAHVEPPALKFGRVCDQCGTAMADDDIFCGECGFVSQPRSVPAPLPGPEPMLEPVPERQLLPEPEPAPDRVLAPEPAPLHLGAPVGAALPVLPMPSPIAAEPTTFDDEIGPTRIVHHRGGGERFILQFSTGESFTVFGTGLIGRNPRPEPGEHFDHALRVLDASRSVSKTHLEFGQESGQFWIRDRFSGNGTVVREPERDAVRCRPDKRYRLTRGSRVDIGEQFFVVS